MTSSGSEKTYPAGGGTPGGGGLPPGEAEMRKDELRRHAIVLARLAVLIGYKEIDCTTFDSMSRGCCEAINNLLEAVAEGGNEWAAANEVLAVCGGIG